MAEKTCSRCHQSKPLSEFKSDSRKPDGKASSCKACNAAPKVGELPLPASRALVPVFDHKDPNAWAARITSRWCDSVGAIVDVGRLLDEAKASLPHGEFTSMCESALPFSARTAQRLMAIAQDRRLSNPTHASHLPASWTTLYELTKLSDEEFDRALTESVIRPDMLRAEAEKIRPLVRGSSSGGGVESGHAGKEGSPVGLTHTRADPAGVASGPPETILPNGARAIMGSRVEPADSLDYFPTPPWATRALIEHVLVHLERRGVCKFQFAWEPACGEGHMAEVLTEYFRKVYASDIGAYGYGDADTDFLKSDLEGFDWIITNPPFEKKSEDFALKALELAGTGVAMFVRLQWLETVGRYERIFRDNPPTLIAFFAERVPLHRDRWEPDGDTATAYIWLVWLKDAKPRAPFWIPPGCRERLTKPDDRKRFTCKPVMRRERIEQEEVA